MSNTELMYPVNLKLSDKTCLVIGAGSGALESIRSLLESGALITVIAPKAASEINTLSKMNLITWKKKKFSSSDLKKAFLTIAATGSKKTDSVIIRECQKRNIPVRSTSDSHIGSFETPLKVRRGNLIFTVSTGGQNPAIASAIKKQLETRYGREYARFLKFMSDIKGDIKDKMLDNKIQKELYDKLVKPEIMDLQARRNLRKFLDDVKKILTA